MASLTNHSRNAASLANRGQTGRGATVFYGWMFLFTVPLFYNTLTNQAKNAASIINQTKH